MNNHTNFNNEHDYILSLKDFNSTSKTLIDKCYNKSLHKNYIILSDYIHKYLIKIFAKCNFVLKQYYNNDIYNFSVFRTNIFLKENQKEFINMKNKIDLQEIKIYILKCYAKINMKGKEFFNLYINNWLDCFCKTKYIINVFNEIEKESVPFLKFFKFLRINCFILINYLSKIEEIQVIAKNYKIKNEIKFILKEEKNKELANEYYSQSLFTFGNEILKYIFNKDKNFWHKMPIVFPYYFSEEKNDFVETNSNLILPYFIRNKLFYIDDFITKSKNIIIDRDILSPYRNREGSLNYIVDSFYPHFHFYCKREDGLLSLY